MQTYLKNTRAKEGVLSLPDGKTFYKHCLQWHLETTMTPEEVHEKGKQEVQRIKEEMLKVRSVLLSAQTGFSHCAKMDPVKSHKGFLRPLDEKGVV